METLKSQNQAINKPENVTFPYRELNSFIDVEMGAHDITKDQSKNEIGDPILAQSISAISHRKGFKLPNSSYTYSVDAAIETGIDRVMVLYKYDEFSQDLSFFVKNNIIPMPCIDDAVEKNLIVKLTMGVFENPLADFNLVNKLGNHDHRALATEVVSKSLVLLKNENNVLKLNLIFDPGGTCHLFDKISKKDYSSGIVHQVHLQYLGKFVFINGDLLYHDSVWE